MVDFELKIDGESQIIAAVKKAHNRIDIQKKNGCEGIHFSL